MFALFVCIRCCAAQRVDFYLISSRFMAGWRRDSFDFEMIRFCFSFLGAQSVHGSQDVSCAIDSSTSAARAIQSITASMCKSIWNLFMRVFSSIRQRSQRAFHLISNFSFISPSLSLFLRNFHFPIANLACYHKWHRKELHQITGSAVHDRSSAYFTFFGRFCQQYYLPRRPYGL